VIVETVNESIGKHNLQMIVQSKEQTVSI